MGGGCNMQIDYSTVWQAILGQNTITLILQIKQTKQIQKFYFDVRIVQN